MKVFHSHPFAFSRIVGLAPTIGSEPGESMRKLILLILAFVVAGFSSCGNNSSENAAVTFPVVTQTSNAADISAIFDKSSVTCGEVFCPNNIAKLTFYEKSSDEYQFGVCSGTLIREGLILTNAHCVPKSISHPGADCSEKIQVKYPSRFRSGKAEMVRCKRVRSIFNESLGNPDLALLEVEASVLKRDPAKFATQEDRYGSSVYAYTMNPQRSKMRGVIRKKNCLLAKENNFYENEFSGTGPILSLGRKNKRDCNIISGNSGSGLFNQRGELLGAIFAKIENTKMKKVFRDLGFTISWRFVGSFLGMAANVNCIQNFDFHEPAKCPIKKNPEFDTMLDFFYSFRNKANLMDKRDSELVITIDKNMRYGVALKPITLAAINRMQQNYMYMYMDFNTFMSTDESNDVVSSLFQSL
jgi:V8-like Glu-specific endopeptidase